MKAEGTVEPRFARVREVFEANFDKRGEVGAAVSVYHEGRLVVDLWGGAADYETGAPWAEDTISVMDSATKALTAMCALHLVQNGELDLDAPVVEYWPEFGQAGKERIPVRLLLTHQAGLPCVDRWTDLDAVEAWDPFVAALERQKPFWEPGTAHGYHGLTFGWLVGEVVRRISGLTPGGYLREHIAPALDLDMWIGLPESEEHRVAKVNRQMLEAEETFAFFTDDEGWNEFNRQLGEVLITPLENTPETFARDDLTLCQRAFGTVGTADDDMNSRRYHAMEFPAANGITSARSLARLYGSLVGEVDGVRMLKPDVVEEASTCHASGPDQVLLIETAWGLGFMVAGSQMFPPGGVKPFGHKGANGTLGMADLELGLGFGYVRNNMLWALDDIRVDPLVAAVYDSLR